MGCHGRGHAALRGLDSNVRWRGFAAWQAGGVTLGKLLLTLYLCDYLGNREFRTEILDLLNDGEAVHSLHRDIHTGAIPGNRGRTPQQLKAISGTLTLLAYTVMAWNSNRIRRTADRDPRTFPNASFRTSLQSGRGT